MKKKIIIIFLLLIVFSYYLYYENTELEVTTYNITDNNIPDNFDNYKIIQISDFHNTKNKKLTNKLINEIEEEKPNIIVITGDLIDSNKIDIDLSISLIEKLNFIAPIYYVTGNHETNISSTKYQELKEKLESNKVTILDNEAIILTVNGETINLIGINDPSMSGNEYIEDSRIIEDEINSIDYDKSKYSILLSHRPEVFDTYVKMDVNLVLTGHAHGGQIRLPFTEGLIAPNQGFFPKYTSGKFEKNNKVMVVSRGIGNSILPFRINNRPELVKIILNKNN